jgi:hypothetical protein
MQPLRGKEVVQFFDVGFVGVRKLRLSEGTHMSGKMQKFEGAVAVNLALIGQTNERA